MNLKLLLLALWPLAGMIALTGAIYVGAQGYVLIPLILIFVAIALFSGATISGSDK